MENTRINDRTMFEEIRNVFVTGESDMDPQLMIDFCERKIASIDRKAERAKELRAEKRAAGDELMETVKSYLTNEFAVTADITATVNEATGEEYSKQKIGYRLRQLVKNGAAEVTDVVVTKEDGKKSTVKKGYKLAD